MTDGIVGDHEDRDPAGSHEGHRSSPVAAPPGRNPELRLFLAVLLVAAALCSPSFRHNENRTWDLVRALAAGRLSIDPDAGNTIDKAFKDGHYYSGGAPGLGFALFPPYLAIKAALPERLHPFALTLLGAALPLALSAVGVRRAVLRATRCTEDQAQLAAIAHALGTTALPLGTRLYAHSFVIACFAWSLALVLRDEKRTSGAALAGFLAACAVTSDYNVGLLAALLGVLVLVRSGLVPAIAFGAGALPPAIGLAVYHQVCFGKPWSTPYDHHAHPNTAALVKSGYGFSYPRAGIALELLFGMRRGFLFHQPFALAGFAGLGALLAKRTQPEKERVAFAIALAAGVVSVLANAARALDWHAGQSFGPRYASAALPFLALGYPRVISLLGRATGPILGTSIAIAFMGAASDWGYWVRTSLDLVWALGLRASGPCILLLGSGPDEVTIASAVLSAGLLAVVAGITTTLLHPRAKPVHVALAVGLVLVASGHGVFALLFHGRKYPDERQRAIVARDVGAMVERLESVPDAATLVVVARALHDRALERAIWVRVLELAPGNERALAEIARIDSAGR